MVQNHVADSRPVTGSLILPRKQDSDFILALKAIQESEAAEQWSRIVEFCKQVRLFKLAIEIYLISAD